MTEERTLRSVRVLLRLVCLCLAGFGLTACSRSNSEHGKHDPADNGQTVGKRLDMGDDITQGFVKNIMLVPRHGYERNEMTLRDCDYSSCQYLDKVKKRDAKMVELKALLEDRRVSSRLQFLILDLAHDRTGGHGWKYENLLLYCCEDCPIGIEGKLNELGFLRIDKYRWAEMAPWAKVLTDRKEEDRRFRGVSYCEVVMVSYFDGSCWRIKPWCYMTDKLRGHETLQDSDFAFFSLLDYINKDLIPSASFGKDLYEKAGMFRKEF